MMFQHDGERLFYTQKNLSTLRCKKGKSQLAAMRQVALSGDFLSHTYGSGSMEAAHMYRAHYAPTKENHALGFFRQKSIVVDKILFPIPTGRNQLIHAATLKNQRFVAN